MIRNLYKDLKRLFLEGGFEIVTPGVARTFIQPDADIIIFLEKKLINQTEQSHEFQQHFDQVHRVLVSLRTARHVVGNIFWVLTVALWGWAGIQWYRLEGFAAPIIKAFVLGTLLLFAKSLLLLLFRCFLGYCFKSPPKSP